MKKIILTASLLSLAAFGTAQAAGDATAGKAKSASCAGCHGADGNSAAPNFPKLAGQNAGYLVKQMVDFKSGARADATMGAMVAGLNEQDMKDLGAFYESQKGSVGTASEDMVELGQTIYRAGNKSTGVAACNACHGATGAGNPQASFPALSGQHAAYTADQLAKFGSSARSNDPGSMMRAIAEKMSDAEIKAVSEYVQGLH